MTHGLSAVIPAHNEEKTVGSVVETVKTAGFFDRVIVVSDGSSDRTAEVARLAGAEVVELPVNSGKGEAVAAGLSRTDSTIVCFLDADLIGLTSEHLEKLSEPVISGRLAMNVGLWDRGPFWNFLARSMPLIGGQRVLRREVFEGLPSEFRSGYRMEIAMNRGCRRKGWRYGQVFLFGLKVRQKMAKVGFWHGLSSYVRMYLEVFDAIIN